MTFVYCCTRTIQDEAITSVTPPSSIQDIPTEEENVKLVVKQSGDDYSMVRMNRKIHFDPLVEIHYIPCLAEYRDAKILPSMFWTSDDLLSFRTEVLYSLVNYLAEAFDPSSVIIVV